jgi:hypothetical protein
VSDKTEKDADKPETTEDAPTTDEAKASAGESDGADENDETDDGDDESDGDGDEAAAKPSDDAKAPASAKKKVVEEDLDLSEDPEIAKEELKLRERQSKLKKKGQGKAALAKAASKKLAEVREKRKADVAQAADAADPLLARTTGWLEKNQQTVQIGGALLVVGLLAFGGYLFYQQKHAADASVSLSKAVADDRGLIGELPPDDDESGRIKDPRPIFKTHAEKRDAALAKYKDVQAKYPGTGAAYLARLGEASVLLDKRDADGAIAAYTDAKSSPLAAADVEVRGRAMEGLGFAYELKAKLDAPNKDKHLDAAMAEYKALENVIDTKGFKELGMYHQSRVFQDKGDKAKAKELLVSLRDRLSKPGETHPFAYLDEMAQDRLRMLDPKAVPPKPKYNEAQLQQMLQKLRMGQGGGGGHGGDDDE